MQTKPKREQVWCVLFLVIGFSALFYILGRTHQPNQEQQLADLSGEPSSISTYAEDNVEDVGDPEDVVVAKIPPMAPGQLTFDELDASPRDAITSAVFPVNDVLLTLLSKDQEDIRLQRTLREDMLADLRAKHRALEGLVLALDYLKRSGEIFDSEQIDALTPGLSKLINAPSEEVKKLFEPDNQKANIDFLAQEFRHCEQGYQVLISLAEARCELARTNEELISKELSAFKQAQKRYEEQRASKPAEPEITITLWKSSDTVSKAALATLLADDWSVSQSVSFFPDGSMVCNPDIFAGPSIPGHIYIKPKDPDDSTLPKDEDGKYPKANCDRFLEKMAQAAREEGLSLDGMKLPPSIIHPPILADDRIPDNKRSLR